MKSGPICGEKNQKGRNKAKRVGNH